MNKEKDRIRELEKRIIRLEKDNEELRRSLNYEIRNVNNSFRTFKEIMQRMQEERFAVKDPVKNVKIENELEQRVLNPLKISVRENFEFFRKAAKEDLISSNANDDYEDYESAAKKPKK